MRIYNGDCLKIMPLLPAKSVDIIITDPPYGVEFEYNNHIDKPAYMQSIMTEWFELAKRLTDTIVITPGTTNMYDYPKPDWVLIWDIPNGAGVCKWGFHTWQPILVYGKDPYLRDCLGARPDRIKVNNLHRDKTVKHPCAKPLEFMQALIKRVSTRETDVILDCFAGSFTTGIACQNLGRHFIGIEIDKTYYEIGKERMAMNRKLFDLTDC